MPKKAQMSNYPNGFPDGVTIRGVPILNLHPGNVFWVSSDTGSDAGNRGWGKNPRKPFATIDYAVGRCTASKGDIIVVMPGHTETISSATGLVMDVAGVQVIGLGLGSLMPTLTLDTAAAATVSITAADCMFAGVKLYSDYTGGLTAGVTVGASADGLVLDGIVFTEATNAKEYLIGISIAAACADVVIQNCRYYGTAGGSTTSIIAAAGAANNLVIQDNYLHGDCSAAAVKLDGAASSDLQVLGNRVINIDTAAGLGIAAHASSTGMMAGNFVTNLKDTVVGLSGAGMAFHENYGSNALGASGIILPAVDV